MISHFAAALSFRGFVLLIRRHPVSFIRADFIKLRNGPARLTREDQGIVRHSQSGRDLHIGAAEEMAAHRIGQMGGDDKSVAARRHIRVVYMQCVFAMRAFCCFNGAVAVPSVL